MAGEAPLVRSALNLTTGVEQSWLVSAGTLREVAAYTDGDNGMMVSRCTRRYTHDLE